MIQYIIKNSVFLVAMKECGKACGSLIDLTVSLECSVYGMCVL